MSTRSTIKHHRDRSTGNGYHLFSDLTDFDDEPPVYLELRGVDFEAALGGDDGRVLVTIPRPWAIALGLLPAEEKPKSASGITYAAWIDTKLEHRDRGIEPHILTRLRRLGADLGDHFGPTDPLLTQVCQLTEADLLRLPNFGRKALLGLRLLLAEDGLRLGMGQ